MDVTNQPWFLNVDVEAETNLFHVQILSPIAKIERAKGRVRSQAKGPRTLDIDILLYGNAVVRTRDLEIPHPRMTERRFVLAPLADLAPTLRHPVLGKNIKELLDGLSGQAVRPR